MIKIEKPYIKVENDKARCYCDIYINGNKKNIWFEVDKKYEQYLVDDRIDAYVVGLLNYAMRNNLDIVSEYPITSELLYNINNVLIKTLAQYGNKLYNIKVVAPQIKVIETGKAIGTGCSCGIDSFSTIFNHYKTNYKDMDITHLCLNNVGAFNECYKDYGIDKVKKERYEITKKAANDMGLEIILTDSNFGTEIPQNHYLTNTYSCCFAIYMLQKLWKIYYLASVGLDFSKFTIINNDLEDSAHYDLLTLQYLSTSGMRIYNDNGEKNRLEKTESISNFRFAQKYLHVCVTKSTNCGICTKCRRTLTALDAIGKLDNFNEVFDVEYYKNNKIEYYKWLWREHKLHDEMNEPTYNILSKRNDFKVNILYKIRKYPYIFLKNHLSQDKKDKLRKMLKRNHIIKNS